MFKSILASSALLILGAIASPLVQAEPTAPKPPAAATPAPAASPKPPATTEAPTAPPSAPPSAPPAQITPEAKISPEELKKFAGAVKQMLVIGQATEEQMVEAVQKEGLTEARFNEIFIAKRDPAGNPTTKITPKEEQQYSQAITKLTAIQAAAQTKMDKVIVSEGLQLDRFQQIFTAAQNDPSLRQEIQKMIQQ